MTTRSHSDPEDAGTGSLRDRRRVTAVREAQRVAVELFTTHGFDGVTVEQVAEAAGVSPVSLYRWFGTKEGLVLRDDYDPDVFAAIAGRLRAQAPLEAVRDALMAELDRLYDAEEALVLARTRLIFREPALLAASVQENRGLQDALEGLFAQAGIHDELRRAALAAACVGVLVAAIGEWQRRDGRSPLSALIHEAFAALRTARWTS